jgi:methionine-rich copper-binding protein CopC
MNTRFTLTRKEVALGLVVLLSVVALLLVQVGAVFAHAMLKTANILPNAVVNRAPERLTMTFTDPVEKGTVIMVMDATNKRVDKNDIQLTEDGGSVGLNTLANGKYMVKFTTVDEDGIVEGEYSFTLDPNATPAPGNVAAAKQEEKELPAAAGGLPATGVGAGAAENANNAGLLALLVVFATGLTSAGTLLVLRRKSRS